MIFWISQYIHCVVEDAIVVFTEFYPFGPLSPPRCPVINVLGENTTSSQIDSEVHYSKTLGTFEVSGGSKGNLIFNVLKGIQ